MLKYRIFKRNKPVIVNIYENEQEAIDNNIKAIPVNLAKEGDYCLSDNGYYLPVTERADIPVPSKKCTKQMRRLTFPGYMLFIEIYIDTGILRTKHFKWSRDYIQQPKNVPHQSIRLRFMAKLIASGIDVMAAYKSAYPRFNQNEFYQKLCNILTNDTFIKLLKEEGIMDSISKQLNDSGATMPWLIKHMMKVIEENDPKMLKLQSDYMSFMLKYHTELNNETRPQIYTDNSNKKQLVSDLREQLAATNEN